MINIGWQLKRLRIKCSFNFPPVIILSGTLVNMQLAMSTVKAGRNWLMMLRATKLPWHVMHEKFAFNTLTKSHIQTWTVTQQLISPMIHCRSGVKWLWTVQTAPWMHKLEFFTTRKWPPSTICAEIQCNMLCCSSVAVFCCKNIKL